LTTVQTVIVSLESLGKVSYSHSIVTMAVSCVVPEIGRDIDRKSSFHNSLAFYALARGSPSQYCHNVWYCRNESGVATRWSKSLMICWAVVTEYRRVTDTHRQTDGRTRKQTSCN